MREWASQPEMGWHLVGNGLFIGLLSIVILHPVAFLRSFYGDDLRRTVRAYI